MSTLEKLRARRDEIYRIAKQYGASNIKVFGSVARGDDTEESDIDFLVDLEPDRSLLEHASLIVALEDLLHKKVDVATDRILKTYVKENALAEAVPL